MGPTVLISSGLRSLRLASPMTDPLAMALAIRPALREQLGSLSRTWVGDYRDKHPAADHWATGGGQIRHSTETQERVFRMAEQLTRRGIERAEVFKPLEVADQWVVLASKPQAAAEAGHRAVTSLVRLAEQSVLICTDRDQLNLQAFGFDPIPFDGRDPAAYAWVMFELSTRGDAEFGAESTRCRCHPSEAPTAIGLARL